MKNSDLQIRYSSLGDTHFLCHATRRDTAPKCALEYIPAPIKARQESSAEGVAAPSDIHYLGVRHSRHLPARDASRFGAGGSKGTFLPPSEDDGV